MAEIKGYASIASPFARKVRVAEIETGQGGLDFCLCAWVLHLSLPGSAQPRA